MAKFATPGATVKKTYGTTPVQVASKTPDTVTYNGGVGFTRTPKSELFLLGVSSFNEDKFYESAKDTLVRARKLIQQIVADGDTKWLVDFVTWLRGSANIRSMAIAIGLEAAAAMLKAKLTGARALVAAPLQRADEPAEAIAYWQSAYGRKLPQPVKRGIADAATRLYNERSIFKYDTAGKTIRFADVIQLVHPVPKGEKQSQLFKFALDRRYNDKVEVPSELVTVAKTSQIKSLDGSVLRKMANDGTLAAEMAKTGMTWEQLSSVISGGMDAKAWEACIPSMGYMALLRNLRNFLDKGVSKTVLDQVAKRIADPAEVAKSRQLPFRFYTAYREVQHNTKLAAALEDALDASVQNVPALGGKTLVLIDMSGSMFWDRMSGDSTVTRADVAAVFGGVIANRADDATVVLFGTGSKQVSYRKGTSVLKLKGQFTDDMGGTNIGNAINRNFDKKFNRVLIITDEQFDPYGYNRYSDPTDVIPDSVPVFVWNLAGYQAAGTGRNNVFTSGGLSDAAFGYIDTVERAAEGRWPWS